MDERVIESRYAYRGRLVNLRVDRLRLDSGRETEREVVEHPGAVAVLPVLPNDDLVLVRQYRHPVGKHLLELPAGTREPSEPAEETARRELAEETGYSCDTVRELVRFYVSPGWANEELIVYVAQGLKPGSARPEDDERLDVVPVSPADVATLIGQGQIADSKTIVGLLAWLGLGLGVGEN